MPTRRCGWKGGQVSPAAQLDRVAAPVARAGVVGAGICTLGFTHVLPKGLDHILFVLGLFLLNRRLRAIVWQVGAFSLAHSIAFGLTFGGAIAFPSSLLEPLIALSIVYVAVGNIVTSELKRWRIALVFGCGLLHGVWFAGTLNQIAVPPSELLLGLGSIVAGAQAAQLALCWWRRRPSAAGRAGVTAIDGWSRCRRPRSSPPSALLWAVERLAS